MHVVSTAPGKIELAGITILHRHYGGKPSCASDRDVKRGRRMIDLVPDPVRGHFAAETGLG
jgi:hypothetical protein